MQGAWEVTTRGMRRRPPSWRAVLEGQARSRQGA